MPVLMAPSLTTQVRSLQVSIKWLARLGLDLALTGPELEPDTGPTTEGRVVPQPQPWRYLTSRLPTGPLSPILHSWTQINLNDEETVVQTQIKDLIRDVPCPWKTVSLISPAVEIMVMDVLQFIQFNSSKK